MLKPVVALTLITLLTAAATKAQWSLQATHTTADLHGIAWRGLD